MPILKFYTSPGQLTDEEKQELATTLTAGYTKMMPAFFVNIMFHEVYSSISHATPFSFVWISSYFPTPPVILSSGYVVKY